MWSKYMDAIFHLAITSGVNANYFAIPPIVDTLLTVGISRRDPHVDNTDDRQTAAAGH